MTSAEPTITPIDVADTTMVQALERNETRQFLHVLNETAGSIYVGFGDTAPADITVMAGIAASGSYKSPDTESIRAGVWIYHAQGADVDSTTATSPTDDAIKVIEGQ
ncbi:MAG: hypothetical protein ACYTGH_09605 [Planctomycetota bacterium]|jgi:hypothetical protein